MTGEWSTGDELAALGVEIAHHHYRASLAAAGVKRGKLPQPLTIPRPKGYQPGHETAPSRRRDGRRNATTVSDVAAVLSQAFPKRG